MKIKYKNLKLQKKTLKLIEQANKIIADYEEQGFILTVRQVYYQFVARNLILNDRVSYGYVGAALNKGRLAGLIDWSLIEDRTRNLAGNSHWNSPSEILSSAARSYRLDSREGQEYKVEVWIEKDALVGMIEPVCAELDLDYFACRGFVSLSEMWRAAQRLEDEKCIILHLGDHDPSGLDMTRDIQDRLVTLGCCNLEVKRIALNMDQIEEFKPPPNPVKFSDSRSSEYVVKYGSESWELDALAPHMIEKLIRVNVDAITSQPKRRKLLKQQQEEKDQLEHVADNWEDLEF